MSELAGRAALVTGAAAGIGRAIAERFARAGASLVLVDVAERPALSLADLLRAEGRAVEVVAGDVAREETLREAAALAVDRFGGLDVLVNNAYAAVHRPLLELSAEEWNHTLDVSLTGMFHAVKYALPPMLRRGRGAIVNLSSVNAAFGTPGMPAYAAAKGGVSAFTRQLAVEYGPAGVRTNAIAPGLIATEELARSLLSDPDELRAAAESCPLRRPGRPEEIAEAALFLASDRSGYVNGQVLTVDGGTSVQWPMVLLRPGLRGRAGLPPLEWPDAGGARPPSTDP